MHGPIVFMIPIFNTVFRGWQAWLTLWQY